MRLKRIGFILLALYFVFLGGSAYYTNFFAIRVLHHWVVTVVFGLWLILRIRSNRDFPLTPLNNALYLTALVWLLSAVFSIDQRMAAENTWFLITHLMIFFVLVDLFQHGQGKLVMETQFIIGAVVVMISAMELGVWYFGTGSGASWFGLLSEGVLLPLDLPPRLAWAMNSTNWLGAYAAPMILLSGGWAMTARRREQRMVLWVLTAALIGVLLLTRTRGGLMSLGAAVGILAVMRFVQIPNLRERITPRLAIGLVSAMVIIGAAGFIVLILSGNRSSGDAVRIDLYRSAVAMTVDHPVLGVGPGIYGRALRTYRDPAFARDRMSAAHNGLLSTAAETGLVGLAISAWLSYLLVRTWWGNWRITRSQRDRIRLEVTIAALIGLGVHSIVDIFQMTSIVSLIALLVAYSITGEHQPWRQSPQSGPLGPAVIALVIVLGFGIWFIQVDQAHGWHQASLRGGRDGIDEARRASQIDPYLNLYPLQVASLLGQEVQDDPSLIQQAIDAYDTALALESTWDTGWLNQAALAVQIGDMARAFEYVQRAHIIHPGNSASLHLARLGEQLGTLSEDEIIALYVESMRNSTFLPLSEFWNDTLARREALSRYTDRLAVDEAYRVWSVHDPERAEALVRDEPTTAAEYWVAGEHTLTVQNNPERAAAYFDQAVSMRPKDGDYYASRARATLRSDPDAAQRDLDIADLLGTSYEYTDAIRLNLVTDPEQIERLRISAVPPRVIDYSFAGVLYGGRIGPFEPLPEMRFPGPGRDAFDPWYALAEEAERAGDSERAAVIYEAIYNYGPGETEARDALAEN